MVRFPIRAAWIKKGESLPTVARHINFISGFDPENASEIRFVTEDGMEYHPISTYQLRDKDRSVVIVDLVPVKYLVE